MLHLNVFIVFIYSVVVIAISISISIMYFVCFLCCTVAIVRLAVSFTDTTRNSDCDSGSDINTLRHVDVKLFVTSLHVDIDAMNADALDILAEAMIEL